MELTLIKQDRIYTTLLPEKVKGQFWVSDLSGGRLRRLLGVEGRGETWLLRSTPAAYPLDGDRQGLRAADLQADAFFRIYLPKEREYALLLAAEADREDLTYRKYVVQAAQGLELSVGRGADSAIRFDNPRVSSRHASLLYYNGNWSLKDHQSENGTFVNQKAAASSPLHLGDCVYIMGLRILIGGNFIAVNNPGGKVRLNEALLAPYQPLPARKPAADEGDALAEEPDYFYRSPRFPKDVARAQFQIDPPPSPENREEMPLALTLGPSITMGMASVAMGYFSISSAIAQGRIEAAVPAVAMSGSMLLGTVLWPILSKRYEKKKRARLEALRQEAYLAYLKETEQAIAAECAAQEKILREQSVPVGECIERIRRRSSKLWDRTAEDDDFLRLRVGIGSGELQAEIRFPEKRFEMEKDTLRQALYALRDVPKILRDIPVRIPLADCAVTSVIGRRTRCLEFAMGLIIQLTALHGYDEVKTVFLYDEEEAQAFAFAKWLPHSWTDDRSFRFLAANLEELKVLSGVLEKEVEARRAAAERNRTGKPLPHYVVFAFSRELALRAEFLKQIYAAGGNVGCSVVCFFDELKNVPKECSAVLELRGKDSQLYNRRDRTGEALRFVNDIAVQADMRELALQLANTPLDLTGSAYQLPNLLSFLDLFEAGRVEHLNPLTRWRDNDPTKSLQALVGVNAMGDPFYLDLHEKYHGPHGLVAGMTGSGKSEFIMTYILSLALNYHPDEAAFLLIDYKGGGMAKSFAHLPHVAGIITNLDGAAIRRSLVSLDSELKRRQAIFNQAGERLGISNIDIYKYQKEYRAGSVTDPLPHLFIISDEFAELKTQQPEFMERLISAARIGRSLGVHLILATQKPAGVVDDQIWSNSRFRVCLKVQDRQDSMDMLKRSDAAELKQTGRFYLQVGYNELFELGQSAWAGAPYAPTDNAVREQPRAVRVLDRNGQVMQAVQLQRRAAPQEKQKKQLDVIVSHLAAVAAEEHAAARPLWLEPLAEILPLPELKRRYPALRQPDATLNPIIGECDDPERQRRFALHLPLSVGGNALLYGAAGGGKTTLLTALVYELLCSHSADALHLYLCDLGSETLRQFAPAPQVGEVLTAADGEAIVNLLTMLREEIGLRKQRFAAFGGDFTAYCASGQEPLPNIVLIINNYAAFTELFEGQEDQIVTLAMEGTKYGIYLVLAAATTNAVRYRVAQNFSQIFVLQLNDNAEYANVLGNTGGLYPARNKGRGLVKLERVYEFQSAQVTAQAGQTGTEIAALCAALNEMGGARAKRVPILPGRVDADFLAGSPIDETRFPVGVNRQTLALETIDLTAATVTLFTAQDEELLEPFARGAAEALAEHTPIQTITLRDETQVPPLLALLVERHNACKQPDRAAFPRQTVIVSNLTALLGGLSADGQRQLRDILQNVKPEFRVNFLLGDEISRWQGLTQEPWAKAQGGEITLWLGDGAANYSYQLNITKVGNELYGELGDGFGLLLRKGKYRVAKLLQSRYAEEDDGDA
ncbi:MAG: type VII secretion protein EssC [Oscillospiraceae bacterium]|nr:type VII secretion protein EssC [Oscillospiraceae bacterium]